MNNDFKVLILMALYVGVLAKYLQSISSLLLNRASASWVALSVVSILSIAIAYIVTELVVKRWKAHLFAKVIVLVLLALLPIVVLRLSLGLL